MPGSRLITLLNGTFKATPVKKLKSGKYAYRLEVRKITGWRKITGIWRILGTRKTYGGVEYTFQKEK